MELTDEARRCLKCKNPHCSANCPVSTPIPQIMELYLQGNVMEAGRILFENNPFSAITSIVCPHERNCMGNCVLGRKGKPVEFYKIEQYISSVYLECAKFAPPPSNGIHVAVVGAGPAGITLSIRLAMKGFKVTLIEARERIGGVLRFGIPEFRLPNSIIDKYDRILYDLGVKFKPNTFVGSTLTIDDMFIDGYKAVFISVGTAKPRKIGLLGETLGNSYYAIDYLRSPDSYHLGKNIAIVGAGNVAIDAARMAARKNPGSHVFIINNRREEDVTCNQHELAMAVEDGVEFLHLLSTIRICDYSLICAKVDTVERADGSIDYIERMNDTVTLPIDSVIIAIGQGPQSAVLSETNVERNDKGLISVNENGHTNRPGVFAAGDIVTGPRTVAEAVAYSMKVADEMIKYCLEN